MRKAGALGAINELFHNWKWQTATHHSLVTEFNEPVNNSNIPAQITNHSIIIWW
jgi:hypothetical protein